jgi:hypothetical protein
VPADDRLDNLTGGSGNFAMVDNNFSSITNTSLRPPALNLSTASIVILRFRSRFGFDFLESINVDISTDGGSGWTNVWQKFGFIPNPTQYVLDLSGVAAGQNNFMFRFRFDSGDEKAGNYWQIDDIEFEVFGTAEPNLPGLAGTPVPAIAATNVSIEANLSWTAGSDATSHDVYFNGESQGNQPGTGFDPGTLTHSTDYTWRIDEVNDEGTTLGSGWSFTTEAAPVLPGPASNPGPADAAIDVSIDADLSWSAGSDATSHDVYFDGKFQRNQPGTGFDPGTLAHSTDYTWRIDEVNDEGTTTGSGWSFTTVGLPQAPGQASNPSPTNGGSDVDVNTNLSWSAGSQAESHQVYFGTSLTPPLVATKSSTSYNLSELAELTTYYWHIDEVNTTDTTVGPGWSFTTADGALTDSVNVSKAEYRNRKSELRVEATSSGAPGAVLTVEDFGQMTYNSNKNIYSFSVKPESNPGTVTVTSSQGGRDIVATTER